MPTKSGCVKLEDLRQGKTVWLMAVGLDGKRYPKPFYVAAGAHLRVAGLVEDEQEVLRSVSFPMYALSHKYAIHNRNGERSLVLSTFHPSRNAAISTMSDGSFAQLNAFTTRKRCARYIADREAGRVPPAMGNLDFSLSNSFKQAFGSQEVTREQLGIPPAY